MSNTRRAWWRQIRLFVALYGLILAAALIAPPSLIEPWGWKVAVSLSAVLAAVGAVWSYWVVIGASSGAWASYLERLGVAGVVAFEGLYAVYLLAFAAGWHDPLLLARASSHSALAIAVWLASRRRPVVRKGSGGA